MQRAKTGREPAPQHPFYDPTQGLEITPAVDIFSLGSIFYTMVTGYWPYRTQAFFSETDKYLDYIEPRYKNTIGTPKSKEYSQAFLYCSGENGYVT